MFRGWLTPWRSFRRGITGGRKTFQQNSEHEHEHEQKHDFTRLFLKYQPMSHDNGPLAEEGPNVSPPLPFFKL
jgi:hypothetical protein